MTRFVIRLQLHGAPQRAYDQVHTAMRLAGFTNTITAENGAVYHLPWGEYRLESYSGTSAQVRDRVRTVLHPVWMSNAILVTEEFQSAWAGLAAVSPLANALLAAS